jgi:hypothetical protein
VMLYKHTDAIQLQNFQLEINIYMKLISTNFDSQLVLF